jgi:hypothetical protein
MLLAKMGLEVVLISRADLRSLFAAPALPPLEKEQPLYSWSSGNLDVDW